MPLSSRPSKREQGSISRAWQQGDTGSPVTLGSVSKDTLREGESGPEEQQSRIRSAGIIRQRFAAHRVAPLSAA